MHGFRVHFPDKLPFFLIVTVSMVFCTTKIHAQQSWPDEIKYNLEAYNFYLKDGDYTKAGNQLANIAALYWNKNATDSAILYYKKAVELFTSINGINELASIYTNIGGLYLGKEDPQQAINYYQKSLQASIQIGKPDLIAIKKLDLAIAYSSINNLETSLKYIDEALKYAKTEEKHDLILSCFSNYHEVFKATGNVWKAEEFALRYNHYLDSIGGNIYNIDTLLANEYKKYKIAHPETARAIQATKVKGKKADKNLKLRENAAALDEFARKKRTEAFKSLENKNTPVIDKFSVDTNVEKVYRTAEVMPEFPGGSFGLKLYIANAANFSPEIVINTNDSIVIEQIINKYGFIVNPKIVKGIHPVLDAEALQAVRQMPAWNPGNNGNENINVYTQIVINFPVSNMQNLLEAELHRLLSIKNSVLKTNDTDSISTYNVALGNLYYYLKENDNASNYYNKALEMYQKNNDLMGVSNTLINIATIYHTWFRYQMAIDYLTKSYKIKWNIDDKEGAGKVLYQLGQIYHDMYDTKMALEYYNKSLKIDKALGNKQNEAVTLNNIGVLYFDNGEFLKSLEYYSQALTLYNKTNNKYGSATTLNNIGNVEFKLNQLPKALQTYENSILLKKEIHYYEGIAISRYNMGNIYRKTKQFDRAIEKYNASIELCKQYLLNDIESKNYKSLAEIFAEKDNCYNTLKYHKLYTKLKFYSKDEYDFSQISEVQVKYLVQKNYTNKLMQKINQLQQVNILKDKRINNYLEELREQKLIAKLESESSLQRIALLKKEKELQEKDIAKKNLQQNALIGLVILILVILLIIAYFYQNKKTINKLLVKQKGEITAQRDIVIEQRDQINKINTEIKDSIHYAQHIQTAILPKKETRDKLLGEHFILLKPRDIVSGDFYWISAIESQVIVAAADCTGHGVPGAFMSMLGVSFLNEIVNKEYITHTGVILRKLRKEIINALQQKGIFGESRDGMDIAVLSINHTLMELQFSGANNPVYIIRNSAFEKIATSRVTEGQNVNLYELRGDKMPIAIHERMDKFTDYTIKLHKGDCLYLFSDGFADQFNEDGKKFKYKQFKELLLTHAQKPMNEQLNVLKQTLDNWQGSYEQIDDILVMGMRI